MEIRKVTVEDAADICEIYNYYIENTAITFETEPVSVEAMEQKIRKLTAAGFPYYVATVDHRIAGYYYLSEWNYRSAYSMTLEVTIYLHPDQTGKGFGSLLFAHLLQHLDRKKIHALIAGIYIPNDESVRLHEKFGFKQVSFMKEIGWKFGQWRDVGHWQLLFPS